jgi:hypothetical protein
MSEKMATRNRDGKFETFSANFFSEKFFFSDPDKGMLLLVYRASKR